MDAPRGAPPGLPISRGAGGGDVPAPRPHCQWGIFCGPLCLFFFSSGRGPLLHPSHPLWRGGGMSGSARQWSRKWGIEFELCGVSHCPCLLHLPAQSQWLPSLPSMDPGQGWHCVYSGVHHAHLHLHLRGHGTPVASLPLQCHPCWGDHSRVSPRGVECAVRGASGGGRGTWKLQRGGRSRCRGGIQCPLHHPYFPHVPHVE